jgi:CheY-like chemotaxis protein
MQQPSSDGPQARKQSGAPLRRLNVLLVDDHAEVRMTTAALLEEMGHSVTEQPSGRDALEVLREDHCRYDLMISDYAMPHLSGSEFLREARELCPGVPALIISGYAEADAISDRADDVEVLQKPFSATGLEDAMRRALARTAAAPSAAAGSI